MYLTQPLHRAVQQMPDAIYSVYRDRTLSHRQVCDRVSRIAGGLRARGVAKDARVGLVSLNTDTFFHVCLAIAWAVVETLHDRGQGAKVLFATHFHELTRLAGRLGGVPRATRGLCV